MKSLSLERNLGLGLKQILVKFLFTSLRCKSNEHTLAGVSIAGESGKAAALIRATCVVTFSVLVARPREQATLVHVCITNVTHTPLFSLLYTIYNTITQTSSN